MTPIKARRLANIILGHDPTKWLNRYYKYDNPNSAIINEVVIMVPDFGTIWSGSLDLTKQYKKIVKLSKEINLSLIIAKTNLFGGNNFSYEYDIIVANTPQGIFWMINVGKHPDWYIFNKKIKRQVTSNELDDISTYKSHLFYAENVAVDKKAFTKIKLPNLKKFKGTRSGKTSPWEQFKFSIMKKYGNKKGEKIWGNLYLTADDIKIMQKNCVSFFKKSSPASHPLLIEDAAAWDYARNGCGFFYRFRLKWTKNGYGYIKKAVYSATK